MRSVEVKWGVRGLRARGIGGEGNPGGVKDCSEIWVLIGPHKCSLRHEGVGEVPGGLESGGDACM